MFGGVRVIDCSPTAIKQTLERGRGTSGAEEREEERSISTPSWMLTSSGGGAAGDTTAETRDVGRAAATRARARREWALSRACALAACAESSAAQMCVGG